MVNLRVIQDLDICNKTVIVRVDLNVPVTDGKITDYTRLIKIVPTIKYLLSKQTKIVLLSHFGRPKGRIIPEMSLAPISKALSELLGQKIYFSNSCIGKEAESLVNNCKIGDVILMENLRFHSDETSNNQEFVSHLAKLGEIYVNDSFSCSHREHASIVGLARNLPSAAGFLLQEELTNLQNFWQLAKAPVMAIIGGSKISTKLGLLYSLLDKVDILVVGGAMANSFLKAQGFNIGKSLYEENLLEEAHNIIKKAYKQGCKLILPVDVVVTENITSGNNSKVVDIHNIPNDKMVADLGQKTVDIIKQNLLQAKTLVWNGPLGVFEYEPFELATVLVAREVGALTAANKLLSLSGGGDIVAALAKEKLAEKFSFISTGGGAFLEWLQGDKLPGVEVLYGSIN